MVIRRNDHQFLLRSLAHLPQKSGLTRTRFTRQENERIGGIYIGLRQFK